MGNTHKGNAQAGEAGALVDAAIADHPVVIFSKSYCPYCVSAKRDIAAAARAVAAFPAAKVFELDAMGPLGRAVQAHLQRATGRRTVPNVFIGGKTVGGGDDVAGYARRGVLKQMLAQAATPRAADHLQEAKALVEDAIAAAPVVVFSKSTCPYCNAAKAALRHVATRVTNFDGPKVFELNTMGQLGVQVQAYLAEKTGRRSVPNVFITGNSIGGGDDVRAFAATGELDSMVAAAVGETTDVADVADAPEAAEAAGVAGVAEAGEEPEAPKAPEAPKTPKDIVEHAIANNPIAVFSKTYCPFCVRAKALIQQTGDGIEAYQQACVLELDEIPDGPAMQQYLLEKTGQRSVPNIFIGGQHIGGCDTVTAIAARNELADLIKNAQASAVPETAATEDAPAEAAVKEIVFGAGCFWGVELAFQRVAGVVKTEVGYSNGKVPNVTYDAICTGLTGAVEVVRVWYDPKVVSLAELLKIWDGRHDPTSLNKQGNDAGTQYRSAVYYNDEEQAEEIRKWSAEAAQRLGKPIVSEIAPVANYCEAEEYHQRYLEKKGQSAEKGSTKHIRCYG